MVATVGRSPDRDGGGIKHRVQRVGLTVAVFVILLGLLAGWILQGTYKVVDSFNGCSNSLRF